jgi:dCTP deaminase
MFEDINEIDRGGILPAHWLRRAVQDEILVSDYTIPEHNYQPASIDLRLGEKAHVLQCSFLPYSGPVEDKVLDLAIAEIDIRDGAILEKNRPYLIPLLENLRLPHGIRARTNPKSSTGRLDIFTRVITDDNPRFDDITDGYHGSMFLEVFSRSFAIRVQTGLSLNQIRLSKGDPKCDQGELRHAHEQNPILFTKAGQPAQRLEIGEGNSIGFSINLQGTSGFVGYRAKSNSRLLDLSRVNHYQPSEFWEPVFADSGPSLILEPEEFYLLSSIESVSIPPSLAAEMTAYETATGELRTHYAGFFDPGFGFGENGRLGGIQPVLEIRAHDVPFMVGPGQKVCTLAFEHMLESPEKWYGPKVGSSYHEAGRILSKHFSPIVQARQLPMFEGWAG